MKVSHSKPSERGFTLVDLIIVLGVVAVLAFMVDWGIPTNAKARACRVQCVNNLKQEGLAFRVWAGDQTATFPMHLSVTNGGTREFVTGFNAYRHFQVMSNELSNPKVLNCPADDRTLVANWNINNSNLSYFVGVEADSSTPTMILCGDHNITNGTSIRNGMLNLTTNQSSGWTEEVHRNVGNILFSDGSVQQSSIAGLRVAVANTGFITNRLQMPVLGP